MDLRGIDVSEPRKQRRRLSGLLLLLVLLAAAGAGTWYFSPLGLRETARQEVASPPLPVAPPEDPPAPLTPPSPPTTPPPAVAAAPPPPTPASPPLPALDASDTLVRELVSALSRRPELAQWLISDELIRRFVASVDNVAEGESPRSHLGFMRPESGYPVVIEGERMTVAPGAGKRYDAVAEAFISIDARGAAQLYQRLKPLIDEAWLELGYPDRDFDEVLEAAFVQLLETPILQGPVELVPAAVTLAYADPAVEELAPAQKLLLRMGPANQRRVQAKLRQLASAMGMATEGLPTASLYEPLTAAEVEAREEAKLILETETGDEDALAW